MDLGLEGRAAIVTGASRGIGRSVALALVAEGCRVLLVGRDREALAAVRAEAGEGTTPLVCDVTDPSSADLMVTDYSSTMFDFATCVLKPTNVFRGQSFWTMFTTKLGSIPRGSQWTSPVTRVPFPSAVEVRMNVLVSASTLWGPLVVILAAMLVMSTVMLVWTRRKGWW